VDTCATQQLSSGPSIKTKSPISNDTTCCKKKKWQGQKKLQHKEKVAHIKRNDTTCQPPTNIFVCINFGWDAISE
jgi:hypothetical protein